jgi:AraC-like DNA-binding protein
MKNLTHIKKVLGYFYESTSVPVCVIAQDGSIQFAYPNSISEVYKAEFLIKCSEDLNGQGIDRPLPLILMVDPSFFLGLLKLDDRFLLLGPVSSIKVTQNDILSFCQFAVHPNRILEFNTIFIRTPLMNYRRFISAIAIAGKLTTGLDIHIDEVVLQNNTTPKPSFEGELSSQVFDLHEEGELHTAYEFEQNMLSAIAAGDMARLNAILLQPVSGRVGQMSSDLTRQEKFTFIAAATLISRAAVRGGMPYEEACSLSDIYCQQMDSMKRVQDINALTYQMAFEFCEKAHSSQGNQGFSKPVRDCCDYIYAHLHEKIRVDQLAEISGFCSKSISQKFTAETGLSVSDYVHREKMREAAQLLRFSTHSLIDISNYLHYSSQSYFTKIFQRFHGLTPKEYRDHHQK